MAKTTPASTGFISRVVDWWFGDKKDVATGEDKSTVNVDTTLKGLKPQHPDEYSSVEMGEGTNYKGIQPHGSMLQEESVSTRDPVYQPLPATELLEQGVVEESEINIHASISGGQRIGKEESLPGLQVGQRRKYSVVVTAGDKKFLLINSFSKSEWQGAMGEAFRKKLPAFANLQPTMKNGEERYRIELGRGGFGVVRLAVELKDDGNFDFVVVKKTRMAPEIASVIKKISEADQKLLLEKMGQLKSNPVLPAVAEQAKLALNAIALKYSLSGGDLEYIFNQRKELEKKLNIARGEFGFHDQILKKVPELQDIVLPIKAAAETVNQIGSATVYQFIDVADFGDGETLIKRLNKASANKIALGNKESVEGGRKVRVIAYDSVLDAQAMADNNKILAHVTKSYLEANQKLIAHGIFHRDTKPANILLDSRGKLSISDFGSAKKGINEVSAMVDYGYISPQMRAIMTNPDLMRKYFDEVGSSESDTSEARAQKRANLNRYMQASESWAMGISLLQLYLGVTRDLEGDVLVLSSYHPGGEELINYFKSRIQQIPAETYDYKKLQTLAATLPDGIRTVVQGLLNPDMNTRLTIADACAQLQKYNTEHPDLQTTAEGIAQLFQKLSQPQAATIMAPVAAAASENRKSFLYSDLVAPESPEITKEVRIDHSDNYRMTSILGKPDHGHSSTARIEQVIHPHVAAEINTPTDQYRPMEVKNFKEEVSQQKQSELSAKIQAVIESGEQLERSINRFFIWAIDSNKTGKLEESEVEKMRAFVAESTARQGRTPGGR